MTRAQRIWLARLAHSKRELARPYGDNFRIFELIMEKLCALNLARPYVHGGYEITELGRTVQQENIVHAEAESARGLGNANEASTPKSKERWLSFAQRWLDEANELRGLRG